mmetsp:Transcript_1228/g.2609  ORF Transcript_1228/g.2609 Transcript_1228/m.2609 type:complete len:355 (-) Transcript_1228:128-1192(-)
MGVCQSKKKDDEEEEEEEGTNDTRLIKWDKYGNLRHGELPDVDPDRQMLEIMELDVTRADQDGVTWYVVESAWLASWLSFVHVDKGHAPCPGPCRNDRLIEWDNDECKYVGRTGLMMSSAQGSGDFRRVSRDTWLKYKEFYPESGPTMTLTYTAEQLAASQVSKFLEILDPPEDPVMHVNVTKKRRKEQLPSPPAPERSVDFSEEKGEEKGEEKDDESVRSASVASVASVAYSLQSNPMDRASSASGAPRNLAAEQYARQAVAGMGSSIRASRVLDSDDESEDENMSNNLVTGQNSSYAPAPSQPSVDGRNLMAEQFSRQAVESAYAGSSRASDRTVSVQKAKEVKLEDIYNED